MRSQPRRLAALPLVAVLVSVLTACLGTPLGPTVTGTFMTHDASPPRRAALLVIEYVADGAPARAALTPLAENVFVGAFTPVTADGRFQVPLPSAADLAALELAPADRFVANANRRACTLTVSDPAARVTPVDFDAVTAPAIVFESDDGLGIALTTDIPVDPLATPDPDTRYVTWAYADRPVVAAATGAGCSGVTSALVVDVALVQGWNQLAWSVTDDDVVTFRLDNDTTSPLFATQVTLF